VRDHDHGQAEAALQAADQPVECRGADRVEAGGRLVEKQALRVKGERAGKTGALAHAAREFGRKLVAGVVRQADQGELERGQLLEQRLRQLQALAPWRLNVLRDGQRAEQGAVLEQHSLPCLQRVALRLTQSPDVLPEDLDLALLRAQQPEDVAQQDRLARAGAADHPEHLARMHLEVEPVMDHLRPEAGAQPVDPHGGRLTRRDHRPSAENTIEKIASNTITRKIATTTASVVLRPTLSALPSTVRPS
jgi:hypothetical protein